MEFRVRQLLFVPIVISAVVSAPAWAQLQVASQLPPGTAAPVNGNGNSEGPIVTPDGRFVAFASSSGNLVTGTDGKALPQASPAHVNVFVRDRQTGATTLVSLNASGHAGGNGDSFPSGISADGQTVIFESLASDLVAGDTNAARDIFARDLAHQTTTLVSVAPDGSCANGDSREAAVTPDGRYVVFVSAATNLAANDANALPDIFVRDLQTASTILVSQGATKYTGLSSAPGLLGSSMPSISDDGRYVAFYSTAVGLAPNVTTIGEIYVRDLTQSTNAWVSSSARHLNQNATIASVNYAMSSNGLYIAYQAAVGSTAGYLFRYNVSTGVTDVVRTNGAVLAPLDIEARNVDISGDGRFVVYTMTNAVSSSVQLWDAQTKLSTVMNGGSNNAHCDFPRVDRTGRFVAFTSDEALLTTNSDGAIHAYVRDTANGTVQMADVDASGAPISSIMTPPHLSASGNVMAFDCLDGATSLTPLKLDVFVRDFSSNTTEVISAAAPSLPPATPFSCSSLSISAVSSNGQFVAFLSDADILALGDTNGCRDVLVHDFATGSNTLVSTGAAGVGNGPSLEPSISADGRYVAFTSYATNLNLGDTNKSTDIFERDLAAGTTTLVSVDTSGMGEGSGNSFGPQLSSDGMRILFFSSARNLTTPGTSGTNLFWRDLSAGVTYAITSGGNAAAAAMTSDGSNVLYAVGAQVSLWNAASHAATNVTLAPAAAWDVALSGNGQAGAVGTSAAIYALDLTTGTISSLGAAAATSNVRMKFSGDGHFLAYLSLSNSVSQLYLYNEQAGSSALLSRDFNAATPGDGPSDSPAVSADGRFVAYRSAADNLAPGDANGAPDIFLYDQLSGSTTLLSASRFGPRAGSGRSVAPVFSGDGQTLFFTSWSSDLTMGDYNESSDVFALALSAGGLGGVTNTPPPLQFTGVQTESTNGPITPDEPLTLTWTAAAGSGYQVQFKNSLDDPQWQPLGNPATVVGGQGSAVDSAPDPQHRFYRIVSF